MGELQLPYGAAFGISTHCSVQSCYGGAVLSQTDRAVLALDVGTSSCRASLYDVQARPIPGRSAQISYAPSVTSDGGAELDPEALLEQVGATIEQVLADNPPH